jgi:DnaJ-class molecular chaperone
MDASLTATGETPSLTVARQVLECPCCHGKGYLLMHDEQEFNPPMRIQCTHCTGTGVIEGDYRR